MDNGVAVLDVEITSSMGLIRGRVNVDTGPMRLADLVPVALDLTDVLTERATRLEEEKGKRISCRAGCGACCRQMVPVSPPEAFYLAGLVDSFPSARKAEVVGRFEAAASELDHRGVTERVLDREYSDDPVMALAEEYISFRLPCPFLVDESCGIHEHRPVACREFNVTSPAEWCADPKTHAIEKVPMPKPLSFPLARLTAELDGSGLRLIPLVLAFRWVAGQEDLMRRHWPGLDLFRRFLALLSR